MTWPVPTGKRKGCPRVRELSNCLPLLSLAAASYSQPVYCTTAIFPAVIASPVPALISMDCIELTPPAGARAGVSPPGPTKTWEDAAAAWRLGVFVCHRRHLKGFYNSGGSTPAARLNLQDGGQAEHNRCGPDE